MNTTDDLLKLVSDEQITSAWGNANFGNTNKRDVIKDALLQIAGDFHTGHTAECILKELGLVSPKRALTKKGRRYLFYAFHPKAIPLTPSIEDTRVEDSIAAVKSHEETIKCPECGFVQLADVEHTLPWWSYVHHCVNCKHKIMESEWEKVPDEQSASVSKSKKSATQLLYNSGIDIMKLNDDFNSNLLFAMERYAEQFAIQTTIETGTTKPFIVANVMEILDQWLPNKEDGITTLRMVQMFNQIAANFYSEPEQDKTKILAQLEIVQGYYNRLCFAPNTSMETVIEWLQDDLNHLQQDTALFITKEIVKKKVLIPEDIPEFQQSLDNMSEESKDKVDEQYILNEVNKMCLESLNPHDFENWEKILANLKLVRHIPHEVSQVKCDLCSYEWTAVRPEGVEYLECPNCNHLVIFENIKSDMLQQICDTVNQKNNDMELETFITEVIDELEEQGYSQTEISNFIKISESTITGCHKREMTAEETVRLILTGSSK